jgi:hypothetical protein
MVGSRQRPRRGRAGGPAGGRRVVSLTLPVPPADPLELAETFPVRELPVSYRYYRLHRHDREPERFGRLRNGVPRSLVDSHRLAGLGLPSPVRVADASNRTVVGRWGLSAELWAGDDYPGSQRWAERLHQAGFAGIWYPARHDPAGQLHSVALFGKPGHQPAALVPYGDEVVSAELGDDAFTRFGILVLPSTSI